MERDNFNLPFLNQYYQQYHQPGIINHSVSRYLNENERSISPTVINQNYRPYQKNVFNVPYQEENSRQQEERESNCSGQSNNSSCPEKKRDRFNQKQSDLLVQLWKQKYSLLQTTRCNDVWNNIKNEINKVGAEKSLKQCKNKLRNLKDTYKKAKENNNKSGASPEFPKYYRDFDEVLGSRDIINLPEFREIGTSNSKNAFDENPIEDPESFDDELENQEIMENMRIRGKQ